MTTGVFTRSGTQGYEVKEWVYQGFGTSRPRCT